MALKAYAFPPFVLQRLIWVPVRLFFYFFFHWKIEGSENLKEAAPPFIFASNHSSEIDPVFVAGALPFWRGLLPLFYTSREREFYKNSGWRKYLYGGILFKIWGSYPVRVGVKNYADSLSNHVRILNDGYCVSIFPEGKKTQDGNVGEGKAGVAYLSYTTGATVIPVDIFGAWKMSFADIFFRRRKVVLRFGKPMTASDVIPKGDAQSEVILSSYPIFASKVMESIKSMHNLSS